MIADDTFTVFLDRDNVQVVGKNAEIVPAKNTREGGTGLKGGMPNDTPEMAYEIRTRRRLRCLAVSRACVEPVDINGPGFIKGRA